jgi:hypothetical protein
MNPSMYGFEGSEHIYECVDPSGYGTYAYVGPNSGIGTPAQPLVGSTTPSRYTRAGLMTTGSRGRHARVRNSQQFLMSNDDELPDLLVQYGERPPSNARAFATLNAHHDRL